MKDSADLVNVVDSARLCLLKVLRYGGGGEIYSDELANAD